MKRILIIEDETAAAVNLENILTKIIGRADVAVTESVAESVEWLQTHPAPDIVFMDIHLADGNSFLIFDRAEVSSPIIFTTAYDRYALQAFGVNSIDYILKPIKESDVRRALDKLERLTKTDIDDRAHRVRAFAAEQRKSRGVFLIPVRDKIIPLKISDIAFFHTFDEKVTAYTFDGGHYPIDKTLETLCATLPPDDFFRANRQFIVARRSVADIGVWFGSRLTLNLSVATPERIVVPKARVADFKAWLTTALVR